MKTYFLLLLLISVPVSVLATSTPDVAISVTKSIDNQWVVEYNIEKPTKRLAFIRNPDKSRITRWQPIAAAFEIVSIDDQEFIVKKNGTAFTQVSVQLTPTYKHLSKDYAPFSPFSDGGVLFYTGRLFACADLCEESNNAWQMSLNFPAGEHAIVNGELFTSTVVWNDANDGQNVYVGKQKPIASDAFIAVIDAGLPAQIKQSLNQDIPKMMAFFESKLGKLQYETKPTLFASYAKVKGSSSQGGTLPNQIFMHWNRDNLDALVQDNQFLNNTLWFFGHESAHLYQGLRGNLLAENPNQSWMHEGHAEFLASDVLANLYPDALPYLNAKRERMEQHCAKGIQEFALIDAAKIGQFPYYYTCGFLIHQAIENNNLGMAGSDLAAYSIWNRFKSATATGSEAGQVTFLSIVDQVTNTNISNDISTFIGARHADAGQAIKTLLKVRKTEPAPLSDAGQDNKVGEQSH